MHEDFNQEDTDFQLERIKREHSLVTNIDSKSSLLNETKHYHTLETTAKFGIDFFESDCTVSDVSVAESLVAVFKAMHYFHSIEDFRNCLILQDAVKEFEEKINQYWFTQIGGNKSSK